MEAQAGESQPSRAEVKARVPWRALTFAVVAVVVGLGAGFLMLRLADSGGVDVRLGDAEFSAGTAASRSRDIAEGGPLLFPDPRGSDRNIFIQHLGEDPNRGWLVFETRWPGSPSSCSLTWEAVSRQFVPPDSLECQGLPRAEADGTAVVLANADNGAADSTTASADGIGANSEATGAADSEAGLTRLPQHQIRVGSGGRLIVAFLGQVAGS